MPAYINHLEALKKKNSNTSVKKFFVKMVIRTGPLLKLNMDYACQEVRHFFTSQGYVTNSKLLV